MTLQRADFRHIHRTGRGRAHHQVAVGRDERDELAEGILDRVLVGEDVGVVELDRGQDDQLRPVVQELGLLVEEGGVVLVALDDEIGPLAQVPGAPEVDRHAAHQERRIAAGLR